MFLRAHDVSLYFPVTSKISLNQTTADQLGGVPIRINGKPFIRALDRVSLSLSKGQRLAVVGHNGSGKSTLLRVLAGLYQPQAGTVASGGEVSGIFNMSIGFRHEASGRRNIVLKGLMAGRSRIQIEEAIPQIAEFTGLGPYLDMPLHTYSQGMALRLAFAITTTFRHDILIMDEWIGAGDASFQEKVIERMNSVVESAHIVVIASHNNQLLRRITDTCLWLQDGKVVRLGSTAEVLDAYEAQIRCERAALIRSSPTPARLPIPGDFNALWEVPSEAGGKEAIRVLAWDVTEFNIQHVKLTVAKRDGEEQLICTGGGMGSRRTGTWIESGMVFRLRDQSDDLLLAEFSIP